MLNPTHLRTLHEVLAAGSFAEAATRLGYTPSAVSQQVAALERATGLALFERDGRSIRPTPHALTVADRSDGVVRSLAALEHDIRSLAEDGCGLARIGSFPTASARLVPQALVRLRGDRQVPVRFDEGEPDELLPLLQAGGIDVAVVYEYDVSPRRWPSCLHVTPLLREELFLLMPARPEQTTAEPLHLDVLRDASWIATRENTGGERCLLQLCAEAGFSPRIGHRSNDFGVIRGLVAAGLGVAIVPALALDTDPRVRALPMASSTVRRNVLALTRSNRASRWLEPILRALESASRDLLREPGVVR